MRVVARNREKFTKPFISGVQGHSKSSMLTFLRSSSPVLVMISSMSVPICNHFHARRANTGKMTFLRACAPISPLGSWGPSWLSGIKFCPQILETLRYHTVKTKTLYLTWAWIGTGSWQTDKRTDGRTDRRTDGQNYHS